MVVCVGGDNEFCVLVKKKDLADPSVAPVVAPELEHDQSQRDDVQRRLMMASILCLIFLIAEIAGGLISGSLAILSDAAHLFSDLMGFVFAIAAGKVASMPGSRNYVSLLLTMLFMFMAKFGLA
jgi:divalent metal cation (Fe/Co/Zn/Cd) transporter